jgi:hypothetical protein
MRRDGLRLQALSPAAQDLERLLLLSLIDLHLRRASTDALAAVEDDLRGELAIMTPDARRRPARRGLLGPSRDSRGYAATDLFSATFEDTPGIQAPRPLPPGGPLALPPHSER